jgi:hypothetical protein
MRYLKRFNESFNIEKFDVEEEEIKEWLSDFLDEHPQLKLRICDWRSSDSKAAFNIIISYPESDPLDDLDLPIITETEFPIKPYLPFLEDRLKERGLKVSYYDYGTVWSMLKIGVSRI